MNFSSIISVSNYTGSVSQLDLIRQDARSAPSLHDHVTGDWLRDATADEAATSRETAKRDGGAGVIEVDGQRVYVVD